MRVLITGASRGIGWSLAQEYFQQGYEVYGVARTEPETWPGISFLELDLSTDKDLHRVFDFAKTHGPFDVCVQNLGINVSAPFLTLSELDIAKMTFANFTFPTLFTQHLISQSLIKEGGSLVFLNSLSHYVGYPGSAVYGATKDALYSLVRSLKLKYSQKYNFLNVYPGPVETDQAKSNSPLNSKSKRMDPNDLAKMIFEAQSKKQSWLVPGSVNKTAAFLAKLSPHLLESIMYKSLYKQMVK